MSKAPQPTPAKPTPDFSGIPEFAKAIRGLAHVPKKEVDDTMEREKARKKNNKHK